jgi:hypothetical protein
MVTVELELWRGHFEAVTFSAPVAASILNARKISAILLKQRRKTYQEVGGRIIMRNSVIYALSQT